MAVSKRRFTIYGWCRIVKPAQEGGFMAYNIFNLVKSRALSSAAHKSVMLNMADRANADGSGVYSSKATIAGETGLSEATVKRAIRDLLSAGLIFERGSRPCQNGFTVEYSINIDAVQSLNAWSEKTPTPVTVNPVHHEPRSQRPLTPVTVTPHPGHSDPQSILEPPMNIGGDDSATPREQILSAMGVASDGVVGPSRFIGGQADMAEAERWAQLPGMTLNAICEEIRRIMSKKRDGPPGTFKYFTRAMQELSGHLAAPQLEPIKGNGNERTHAYQPAQGGNARGRSAHQVMFDAFQSVAAERSGRAGTDDFGN